MQKKLVVLAVMLLLVVVQAKMKKKSLSMFGYEFDKYTDSGAGFSAHFNFDIYFGYDISIENEITVGGYAAELASLAAEPSLKLPNTYMYPKITL